MANMEKALKGLEHCSSDKACGECVYYGVHCIDNMCADAMKLLKEQPQWISVKDRMPPNADHPGAFCPRYLVMTDFGITIGWYNPDKGKWYGVGWWMYDTNRLEDVDFEKGDIPKRVILPVEAWMPLPEPPEEVKQAE